jgi:phage/plasmid-associated DNA primase
LILSNELPNFQDASGAIATRFVVLNLTETWLGREDTELVDKLLAELPGILNWALEGLVRLTQQGRLTEPAGSAESVLAIMDNASPKGAFVQARCDVAAGLEVPFAGLFDAWAIWCGENGHNPGNAQNFARELRAVVPSIKLARLRDGGDGKQIRTYQGIALKTGALGRGESRLLPSWWQRNETTTKISNDTYTDNSGLSRDSPRLTSDTYTRFPTPATSQADDGRCPVCGVGAGGRHQTPECARRAANQGGGQ